MSDAERPAEASLLPDSVQQLAAVVGWPNALAIIDCYAGRTIVVSERSIIWRMDLERLLGTASFNRLMRAYGNQPFYIPACANLARAERNRRIRDEVKALEKTMSTRAAVTQSARQWRLTERTIWRALSPAGQATEIAPAVALYQLPLI